MKYQKHTTQFDGIVAIESINEADFVNRRFHRKVNRMEREALDEIEAMVGKAKRKIIGDPKPRYSLADCFGRGWTLASQTNLVQGGLSSLANQAAFSGQGAALQHHYNPFLGPDFQSYQQNTSYMSEVQLSCLLGGVFMSNPCRKR